MQAGSSFRSQILYIILALIGYALIAGGLALIFRNDSLVLNPLLIGIFVIVLTLFFNPFRKQLQQNIDRVFFRNQTTQQDRIIKFNQALSQAISLQNIVVLLRGYIDEGLHPSTIHIYLRDNLSGQYIAAANEHGEPTSDLRFPGDSQFSQIAHGRVKLIHLGDANELKKIPHSDQSRLSLLGGSLLAILPGAQQLVGWVVIGPKIDQKSYSRVDRKYLEWLCEQVSPSLERARIVENLEWRVREMDVLSRVAQGVNITPAFDDILELIFAQTSQMIACHNFHIALKDKSDSHLYYAFNLVNNERITSDENKPLSPDAGLDGEIIHSQRSILTGDYHQECITREVEPTSKWIYAWMGVPLNAGSETIGAITLGSRDPLAVYTEQQRNLLQAIADQAAGAIVKTRLINESEQRARQLNILNEIGRSLTSTLETTSLLNQILYSATEILNCEAGSLFMVDVQTDELIFEVTAGPVAADLIGQRLPPGTGFAGQTVDTGKPIIANDARRSTSWSNQTDNQTGFVTRDLLVVPMQLKEKVIGVIEVINKKDGSRFTDEDQELLSTFASQAAIAIENARLYTQTDKALSARVEELSVMQRIDRELNTSLEIDRVLRISLDWSIRQSGADAGLIGLVEQGENGADGFVRVMASQGFAPSINMVTDGALFTPVDGTSSISLQGVSSIRGAVESGQIQRQPQNNTGRHIKVPTERTIGEMQSSSEEKISNLDPILSEGGKAQIIVPIRRRNETIGILLLESKEQNVFGDEIVAFLSRLSDHAAIAISNAQLYADLQSANLAKSEFVSLVSHELKTPMTSIKGYADLLAKGAVGPINESQTNFLNTIRSNVNRMSTLVSDLADVSRIETGRMRLDFNTVALDGLVNDVVRSSQAQIDEKSQVLVVNLPGNLPLIWADSSRLVQVLANLVSNANKYTPDGGTISITAMQVTNEWDPQGAPEVIRVDVKDSGYGISPEEQSRIFQKFFRSEDQQIRESPGTGLGLNITRYLVEMQGGRIWFSSVIGEGTTFSFTVPVTAATKEV